MILFISGGARSGKSCFAEQTALSLFHKEERTLYYIATAKKSDDEMVERIRIHRGQRGKEWQPIEEPYDLDPILSNFKKGDVILIDCLTIWLSNVMFELEFGLERIEQAVNSWLHLAHEKQFHLLIVSNDVNEGVPSDDADVLTYIYALQQLHKIIVRHSEFAVEVQAGLPTYWKGVK